MVAEKPSIAQSVAELLSDNNYSAIKGKVPIFEFSRFFNGTNSNFLVNGQITISRLQ